MHTYLYIHIIIFFNHLRKIGIWTLKQEQKIHSDPTPSLNPSHHQRGFPGAGCLEAAFLGGGEDNASWKAKSRGIRGRGCWLGDSVFMENKMQDSGGERLVSGD